MLKEYAAKKGLDAALASLGPLLLSTGPFRIPQTDEVLAGLAGHMNLVTNWSKTISFTELRGAKELLGAFVPLDLYVYPLRIRASPHERVQTVSLTELFNPSLSEHIVLMGQPGAGKTTSVKYFCNKLLFDEHFLADRYDFPLLLQLRSVNKPSPHPSAEDKAPTDVLISPLLEALGFSPSALTQQLPDDTPAQGRLRTLLLTQILVHVLNSVQALVVLDGFDEILSPIARDLVITEFRNLCEAVSHSTFLLTSRTGEFTYHVHNAASYELKPLSPTQIAEFGSKWLGDQHRAVDFVRAVRSSPFADTAIKPLSLAHLCAIYERVGRIPDKPKTVYRRVINLLLQEWDEQRSVVRKSRYANFETDRKFDFLCHLAFELTFKGKSTSFDADDLQEAYFAIYKSFDLLRSESRTVVAEIESHTGILVEAGYRHYEFAHKSLQEYLAAEYVVRLPGVVRAALEMRRLPNELAIAVAISSDSSSYLCDVVLNTLLPKLASSAIVRTFVTRLVQEKPDFGPNKLLPLALAAISSLYFGVAGNLGDEQLKIFYDDPLKQEFDLLHSSISKHNNMARLLENYEPTYIQTCAQGDDVQFFIVKRDSIGTKRWPERLAMKRHFIGVAKSPRITASGSGNARPTRA